MKLAIASLVVLLYFLHALQLQQLFDSPETADSATQEESHGGQRSPKGHFPVLNQNEKEEVYATGHSSGLKVLDLLANKLYTFHCMQVAGQQMQGHKLPCKMCSGRFVIWLQGFNVREAWGECALRHCCHRLPCGAVIVLSHFSKEVVSFSQLMCSIALESQFCMGWTVCVRELGAVH